MPPKILVIDDNPVVLMGMEVQLADAGYEVLTSESGEDGLRIAIAQRPDAAIIDYELPGIDGMAVIHRLATEPSLGRIPCILLTGAEQAPAELEGLAAGADAYVRKGTELEVILARLKALLRDTWRPPEDEAESAPGAKSIVALSDDPKRIATLTQALVEDGYSIESAPLERAADAVRTDGSLACVVLDVDAIAPEILASLRERLESEEVPIVALIEADDSHTIVSAIEAGAEDCVPRSSGLSFMLGRIRAQLRRKRVDDASRQRYEQRLQAEQARAARELAETRAKLLAELEEKNEELSEKNDALADMLRELRARDQQFRTVARCVPGVVYLCKNDEDRSMLFMSPMIERLVGYRAVNFTDSEVTWSHLVHPEDKTRVVARIESALAQKNHFVVEYRLRGSDALYKWVEERGRAIFDDDDDVRCIGGTIFDITERKEAEEELERFRTESFRKQQARKKGRE